MTSPMPEQLAAVANAQPPVLTIAGSDPSGGAGIQADLKAFAANGCYGMSVLTALTAQNTVGVQDVHPVPAAFVRKQLESVLTDIPPLAVKTGMLFDQAIVTSVADTYESTYPSTSTRPPLVVDPVSVSTSGHTLLDPRALSALKTRLIPLATLVTPNKSEAELLLGNDRRIQTLTDAMEAAGDILSFGAHAVLMKGGHLHTTVADVPDGVEVAGGMLGENMEILLGDMQRKRWEQEVVVDVLVERGERPTLFVCPRIESRSTHGTGCTLSAAIAGELAKGRSIKDAVRAATEYTHHAIANARPLGKGHGPLNHSHPNVPRAIPLPTTSDPHPLVRRLIASCAGGWKAYVEHEFVRELGKGTLRRECFVHFLKQDYLYLKYYARAHGLLAAKSTTYDALDDAAVIIRHIVRESGMHREYCSSFGISLGELESEPESAACTAYGAFLLEVGQRGDRSLLLVALAACLLGYGEVGLWLKREADQPGAWAVIEGNPYRKWIEDYSGEEYQGAVRDGIERLEAMAVRESPGQARFEEWREVWERCAKLEREFWDMGLNLS